LEEKKIKMIQHITKNENYNGEVMREINSNSTSADKYVKPSSSSSTPSEIIKTSSLTALAL